MEQTILLVEDDESDAFFMQRALKKAGIANPVRIASDGKQAINYFKGTEKFSNRNEFPLPGLVLLDLKLPYVMGLDVLKWIRQQPDLSPIVLILSASSDVADISTAYHLGANGYLVKPSQARQLDDIVKSIKDFWLTHNTPPSLRKPVVADLAQSRRQQVLSTPEGVRPADVVGSYSAEHPRDQGMQPIGLTMAGKAVYECAHRMNRI